MLLFNAGDEPISHKVGSHDHQYSRGQEILTPARTYVFDPVKPKADGSGLDYASAILEVPDTAAALLLQHLTQIGLVRIELGDDFDEARERGRRRLQEFARGQIEGYWADNAGRAAAGRAPMPPQRHHIRYHELEARLRAEENGERYRRTPLLPYASGGDLMGGMPAEQRFMVNAAAARGAGSAAE